MRLFRHKCGGGVVQKESVLLGLIQYVPQLKLRYIITIKGCTRLDYIRNEDIRNELGICPLSEKIIEYRNKWKAHLQRMEHTRIPLQAYKYQPSGKRDIGRPRMRWRETQQY
jgi:hypothetical protein